MRARPLLCLVTDRRLSRRPLVETVAAAVAAGVDWVQVRERDLGAAALATFTDALLRAARDAARARGGSVSVVVNRRTDVALATGADGVHLGFDAVSVADARDLLGNARLVGVSTHAPDEVLTAAREGASYVLLAPIFTPLSKAATRPALGAAALRAATVAGVPLLAQGGVQTSNVTSLLRAGASGVAVTGAILQADDPAEAAAALRRALDTFSGPAEG